MTFVSKAALAAVLGLGTTIALTAQPADAQRNQKKAEPAQVQVNDAFRTAALAAEAAVKAGQIPTAEQQLAAADAAATNDLEKYYAATLRLQVANAKKDNTQLAAAIDTLLANPRTPPTDVPGLTYNRGVLALNAKQPAVALQNFERAKQLGYADPELDLRIAQLQIQSGNVDSGAAAIDKAIAAKKAAGQPVPSSWYDLVIAQMYRANKPAETAQWMRRQLADYPTQANWRKALVLFRDRADRGGASMTNATRIDVFRLMRDTRSLADQNDYREYAVVAADLGLPYETVAIVDEGRANGKVPSSVPAFNQLKTAAQAAIKSEGSLTAFDARARSAANGRIAANTANAYLANGDNAKAIEFLQLAQQKGGVDADEVNTRLGIALARAGRKDEAKQAFAAVKAAPRNEIANFWTLYIDNPPTAAAAPAAGN